MGSGCYPSGLRSISRRSPPDRTGVVPSSQSGAVLACFNEATVWPEVGLAARSAQPLVGSDAEAAMGQFDGQVAVVTGGATGIGFATARALAVEGAQVFVAGRGEDHGTEAVSAIATAGGRATFVRTDVGDDAQVEALAEQAASDRGRIDIWFNNAGIEGHLGPFTEADDAAVQQLVNTNFKGVFSGMRHAARRMGPGGVIVNMASFNGTKLPVPIAVPYGATKAAVVSMTRSAALGLQERGIAVFALCPYIVDTPMLDRLTGGQGPEVRAAFAAQFAPSKRLTTPDEIAQVVIGLCNGTSGHQSGDVLVVDAGPSVTPF